MCLGVSGHAETAQSTCAGIYSPKTTGRIRHDPPSHLRNLETEAHARLQGWQEAELGLVTGLCDSEVKSLTCIILSKDWWDY